MPFGTVTGAFDIGTHHDVSLAYLAGHDPTFGSGVADASSMLHMIDAFMVGLQVPRPPAIISGIREAGQTNPS
jgi:hypothetical protein